MSEFVSGNLTFMIDRENRQIVASTGPIYPLNDLRSMQILVDIMNRWYKEGYRLQKRVDDLVSQLVRGQNADQDEKSQYKVDLDAIRTLEARVQELTDQNSFLSAMKSALQEQIKTMEQQGYSRREREDRLRFQNTAFKECIRSLLDIDE
jgi:FtsZ-binding cell division protein ZapB